MKKETLNEKRTPGSYFIPVVDVKQFIKEILEELNKIYQSITDGKAFYYSNEKKVEFLEKETSKIIKEKAGFKNLRWK